ncbi:amidohydrolase [Paenarthrobacter sp. NPDC058040]|uniref:amidohydrolase n=1 Tax=unclassified Paenarthrobacter TaxID=2634190 RepID=UPI0036D924EB
MTLFEATRTSLAVDGERMTELYRWFHSHPELSLQEHNTAVRIEQELDDIGIAHFRCGGTGVVGVIENGDGPVVAFRADMDGLPVEEDTGLSFASTARASLAGDQVPVMHACGHDIHMTALLTAARVLCNSLTSWSGTVVLIFQPAEEIAAGARAMIEDGLWDRAPRPSVVYGQHVMPLAQGSVGYASGHTMTLATSWRVSVLGRGSHASQPHASIDPITLGAHIITRLQTIVSREVDPRSPAVVTVGTFHAGVKENVIADCAELTLNFRSFDQDVHEHMLSAARRIISSEASASGAPEPRITELYRFPRIYNDPAATEDVMAALSARLGADAVHRIPPMMHSEDFGLLAEAISVPIVYWFVNGHQPPRPDGETVQNHSPHFAPAMQPTLGNATEAALEAILHGLGTSLSTVGDFSALAD